MYGKHFRINLISSDFEMKYSEINVNEKIYLLSEINLSQF